ncbi:MAG: citrulline utilization hydrolase CtlX [Flavobacteriaceae bacterium]
MKQYSSHLLMVRPSSFRKNEETAVNNYFQAEAGLDSKVVLQQAQANFDAMVQQLRQARINVTVFNEPEGSDTPDALFPNNWISMHHDRRVALYPMFAENRRRERREEVLDLLEDQGFEIEEVIDYSSAEEEGLYLEGTGSMILDHENRMAYCALSERADEDLFIEFCEDFEYTPFTFNAFQTVGEKRLKIYHTNVMMCVADRYAVVCLECIDDESERKQLKKHLKESSKTLIPISEAQMHQFAGNMLQVGDQDQNPVLIMSDSAYKSLTAGQIKILESFNPIVHPELGVIETCGGGSARCMIAEIFLPKAS